MQYINLGHFRINNRDQFNPSMQYKLLDGVKYNGSYYMCINDDTIDAVACIGIAPEGQEKSKKYWVCIAEKGDKGDIANKYDSFITLKSLDWNFLESDKIIIPKTLLNGNAINITNAYDGCCGLIISEGDIKLPLNSHCSVDYYYTEVKEDQYYIYTFVYRAIGDKGLFIWNRTTYDNEVIV